MVSLSLCMNIAFSNFNVYYNMVVNQCIEVDCTLIDLSLHCDVDEPIELPTSYVLATAACGSLKTTLLVSISGFNSIQEMRFSPTLGQDRQPILQLIG